MTRLAIIADIHGNYPALQAIQQHMAQFNPDHVIVAGDLINSSPFNHEVLTTIFDNRWAVIRGNHEFYFLNHISGATPNFANTPQYNWLYEDVKDWYNIIAALPDTLTLVYPDAPPIRVWHARPHNNRLAFDILTTHQEIDHILTQNQVQEKTYIFGHYHIGFERHTETYHIINPGPAGLPNDGIRKANYVIMDSSPDKWEATFHRVDYDFAAVEKAFREQDIFKAWGVNGRLLYETQKQARWIVNSFYIWMRKHHPHTTPTDNHVDQYLQLGNGMWEYFLPSYRVNYHLFHS